MYYHRKTDNSIRRTRRISGILLVLWMAASFCTGAAGQEITDIGLIEPADSTGLTAAEEPGLVSTGGPSAAEDPGVVSTDDSGLTAAEDPDLSDTGGPAHTGGVYGGSGNETDAAVENILASMSLEEKVLQMFVISPEALTGYSGVTAAGEATREAIGRTPVGGLLYMEPNLQEAGQIREMLANTQQYSVDRVGLKMFLCVDEEGGSVCRISGRGILDEEPVESMQAVGLSGSVERAYRIGLQMGRYLSDLGFNVDFAPVADTMTNPENQVVMDRSFGSDPEMAASMCVAVMNGLHEYGVLTSFKHFPGHGSTSGDTHEGYAASYQTMDDLLSVDLVPFQAGADNQTDMIMVGHIALPEVTGDTTPATLSYDLTTGLLRNMMGYDGLIITDSLGMGAITQNYTSADAAVKAVQAGADLLLTPADFPAAYSAVVSAVDQGTLTGERIDESVRRIVKKKLSLY